MCIRDSLMLRLGLAALYIAVNVVASLIIGYSASQLSMLYLLLFNQVLVSFILYLRSNLAGLHLFKTDSIISVLDRAITVSYTHLRAHETPEHLVCRLLLE